MTLVEWVFIPLPVIMPPLGYGPTELNHRQNPLFYDSQSIISVNDRSRQAVPPACVSGRDRRLLTIGDFNA